MDGFPTAFLEVYCSVRPFTCGKASFFMLNKG